MTTTAPRTERPRTTGRASEEAAQSLRLVVDSGTGLRSQVWTITSSPGPSPALSVAPAHDVGETGHVYSSGSWSVRVATDTAEQHGLDDLPIAPPLGQKQDPPTAGWHTGLILLVPMVALTPADTVIGPGVTTVAAPEQGRCVQVTVMLGESRAEDPGGTAPGTRAGRLMAEMEGVRVWAGQTVLSPDMIHHLIRVRQHLVEIAPPEPRQLVAFSRFRISGGIDGVVDLGLV